MIDIVSVVKEVLKAVFDVILLFFKIPAMIWFEYVPAPMRWFTYTCIILFSLYIIRWAYKNRYEWMHRYNY